MINSEKKAGNPISLFVRDFHSPTKEEKIVITSYSIHYTKLYEEIRIMKKHLSQYLEHLRIEKGLSEKTIEVYERDLLEFQKITKKTSVNKLARSHIRGFLCFLSSYNFV